MIEKVMKEETERDRGNKKAKPQNEIDQKENKPATESERKESGESGRITDMALRHLIYWDTKGILKASVRDKRNQ